MHFFWSQTHTTNMTEHITLKPGPLFLHASKSYALPAATRRRQKYCDPGFSAYCTQGYYSMPTVHLACVVTQIKYSQTHVQALVNMVWW